MADLNVLRVKFDLIRDQGALKPRYVQGQELLDWEQGPDMVTYLHTLRQKGYLNISKGPDESYLSKCAQTP